MTTRVNRNPIPLCHAACRLMLGWGVCAMVTLIAAGTLAQTNWTVLGWNNLGMHCGDAEYSVLCLLPPYNTIHAQTIDASGRLVGGESGVTVTYQAVADPTGSRNATSIGKLNFWQYVQPLFGVALQPDVGLPVPGPNSYAMPGPNNVPQGMGFDPAADWFAAYGIPITPFDDAGRTNTYPLMRLQAKSGNTVVATADIVLPISAEINCAACHGSLSSPAAKPAAGWVNDPSTEKDFRLNVLRLHDDRQLGTPVFAAALANGGYSPAGLYASVVTLGKPILCASCHLSEALPGSGQAGITPLTEAIHSMHATVADPANGLQLGSSDNRTSCYYCHPGQATKCLRGVMGRAVGADGHLQMECQSCHGTMSVVGASDRTGWLDEPTCQSCHTGDAVKNEGQIRYTSVFSAGTTMRTAANPRFATNPDTPAPGYSLYRFSKGHGGLYCEACHGSTHAEYPSIDANDNIYSIQQQGYIGPLAECQSCHNTQPSTINGGPHGLHTMGDGWVKSHHDAIGSGGAAQCQVCHGTDYRGTVLSRARTDRTLNAFGTKRFWRGFQIGCYTCHNGPGSSSASPNRPAVVQNRSVSTSAGTSVGIPLQATDADGNALVLRVVSQAGHGQVGLNGTTATYFPDPGFSGNDTFTFAAWDGSTDSNLGVVTVTVGGGAPCEYTLTPPSASVDAGAGNGTVMVGTAPGCSWTAVNNASWLTITGGANGSGPGTVSYSFTANPGSSARSGTLTIAGMTYTVTQAGLTCSYAIIPASVSLTANARTGTVAVSTSPDCEWTASSTVPWITITSGAGGLGAGTVAYMVAANDTATARVGTLNIAGFTFTVNQAAAVGACVYTISPTSRSVSAGATTGSVAVDTTAGCSWTAASDVSWISVSSGASGTGPGTVSYAVQANPYVIGRAGTLTIAGLAFTLNQGSGDAGCAYTITPTNARYSARGGLNSVKVDTREGCPWTAKSNADWIRIRSGFRGTGDGTVNYEVRRNSSRRSRIGTMTIAGVTFAVSQSGATSEQAGSFGKVLLENTPERQRLTAEYILQNDGDQTTSKVQPAIYLSADAVWDESDLLLWSRGVEGIAPGESAVNKFRTTLPSGTVTRGKYLLAEMNASDPARKTGAQAVVYGPLD